MDIEVLQCELQQHVKTGDRHWVGLFRCPSYFNGTKQFRLQAPEDGHRLSEEEIARKLRDCISDELRKKMEEKRG